MVTKSMAFDGVNPACLPAHQMALVLDATAPPGLLLTVSSPKSIASPKEETVI